MRLHVRSVLSVVMLGGLLAAGVAGCGGTPGGSGSSGLVGAITGTEFIHPVPGSAIQRHDTITIGFDTAVNPYRFSVYGAMVPVGDPAYAYSAQWSDDRTQVALSPVNYWLGGADRDFNLSAQTLAAGPDGVTGLVGSWTYDVEATPAATLTLPIGNANSRSVYSPLIVDFTDAADPDSLECTGEMFEVAYTVAWETPARAVVTPTDHWPADYVDARVTAQSSVTGDLMDSETQDIELAFTGPAVEPSANGKIAKNQPIWITFSEAVNTATVQLSGSLAPQVGNGSWSQGGKRLVLDPGASRTVGPGATLTVTGFNTQGAPIDPASATLEVLDLSIDQWTTGATASSLAADGGTVVSALDSADGIWVYNNIGGTGSSQQKLPLHPFLDSDNYLAISGDTLAAGRMWTQGASTDSVYVYTRSGGVWSEQTHIDPPEVGNFGYATALDGNTLAVSNPRTWDTYGTFGPVRIYTRSGTTWTLQQEIMADDLDLASGFGVALALSGDTLLVGASGRGECAATGCAVYVYTRSAGTWTLQAKLPPQGAYAGNFGMKLALRGDSAFVGDRTAGHTGRVYAYTRSGTTWTLQQTIAPSYSGRGDFGSALGYDGTWLIVGGTRNDYLQGSGPSTGAVGVFQKIGGTWYEVRDLTSTSASAMYSLGTSVAVTNNVFAAAAPVDYAATYFFR